MERGNDNSGNDNIYQNLRGLFWSAFIGIVSFQVLAPNIWGYMHKLVGVGYPGAYWTFIIAYLAVVPLLVVVWLLRDYRLLIRYLPPLDNPDWADAPYRRFLDVLIGYVGAEALITLLLLKFQVSGSNWFGAWAIVNGAICLALLIIGSRITYVSLLRGKDAKNTRKLRASYWQMIALCFGAYLFLAIVGIMYLNPKPDDRQKDPDISRAGTLGLALLPVKDNMEKIARKIRDLSDSLEVQNTRDSLSLMLAGKNDTAGSEQIQGSCRDVLRTIYALFVSYGDSAIRSLDLMRKDSSIGIIHLPDISGKQGLVNVDRLELASDSLVKLVNSIGGASSYVLRTRTHALLHEFTRRLLWYVSGLERQVDHVSKDQLGKELRDTQKKGMFLFMGLFVALLGLYIFLKMSGSVLQERLNEPVKSKRIKLAAAKEKAGHSRLEAEIMEKEDRVNESSGLITNAWLFITLTVWLLIPFFKPVEDDKIDTSAPFKMLTASGQAAAYWGPREPPYPQQPVHYYSRDTINEFYVHVDSIVLPGGKTDTVHIDRNTMAKIISIESISNKALGKSNDLDTMIKSMKRKLDHIETDTLRHRH